MCECVYVDIILSSSFRFLCLCFFTTNRSVNGVLLGASRERRWKNYAESIASESLRRIDVSSVPSIDSSHSTTDDDHDSTRVPRPRSSNGNENRARPASSNPSESVDFVLVQPPLLSYLSPCPAKQRNRLARVVT